MPPSRPRGFAASLTFFSFVVAHATTAAPRLAFVDATPGSGIVFKNLCGASAVSKGWLTESMGAGAAWLDFDRDGHLDLYLVNGSTHDRPAGRGEPNRLFRGDGHGRFTDVTEKAGVGDRGWGYGATVGDYDNDGDPDIYVTNLGANVLYRNNGDSTFTDVTATAGVGDSRWSTASVFFDADNDGDLDLYVGNYMQCDPKKVPRGGTPEAKSAYCTYKGIPVACGPLGQVPEQDTYYRNEGGGRFRDATREAGFALATPRYALGAVTGDYDNDGDTDLYVANDSVANSLWRNRGDGTFEDVGMRTLTALNGDGRPQAGMGTDFGDYDRDGWIDIVVTNFAHDLNTIYRNHEGKYFLDDSTRAGLGVTYLFLSWGTAFRDFDLDGDLDLFIANGHIYPQVDGYAMGTRYRQPNHLFVNQGAGRLSESSKALGPGFAIERSFRGAAFADYDDDGDIDVLVTAIDDAPLLLRNENVGGHWLEIRLVGKRSNRDGIGARITVAASGKTWIADRHSGGSYLSSSDPRVHFGLGATTRVSSIEVRWPSGTVDRLIDVEIDRLITIEEGSTIANADD